MQTTRDEVLEAVGGKPPGPLTIIVSQDRLRMHAKCRLMPIWKKVSEVVNAYTLVNNEALRDMAVFKDDGTFVVDANKEITFKSPELRKQYLADRKETLAELIIFDGTEKLPYSFFRSRPTKDDPFGKENILDQLSTAQLMPLGWLVDFESVPADEPNEPETVVEELVEKNAPYAADPKKGKAAAG